MSEDALPGQQDFTFVFAETHGVSVNPVLHLFDVPLNGSPDIQHTRHSSSLALFTDVIMMYFVLYPKLLMKRLNSVSSSTDPSMTFMACYQLRLQNHDLCPLSVGQKSSSVSFSFTL